MCGENREQVIRAEGNGIRIIRCPECGLIRKDPLPVYNEISKIYDKNYYEGNGQIGYTSYLNQRAELLALARERLEFVMRYIRSGRLLDVGCATGEFLEVANKIGWTVTGVEISNFSSSIARERTGLDIRTGTLAECGGQDEFDVITMWDMLEHVIDPVEELRKTYQLLRKKGLILVCTPNASSLRAIREKDNWHGYRVSLEHLYFFTPKTILQMLKKVGFDSVSIITTGIDESLETLLNPFKDCLNLPPNLLPQSCQFSKKKGVKGIFRRTLERLGFGHTMIAIGRVQVASKPL